MEPSRYIEAVKRLGGPAVRYAKLTYTKDTATYHIKIYLEKPIDAKAVVDIVGELQRLGYSVRLYAPHARAIRIDFKK